MAKIDWSKRTKVRSTAQEKEQETKTQGLNWDTYRTKNKMPVQKTETKTEQPQPVAKIEKPKVKLLPWYKRAFEKAYTGHIKPVADYSDKVFRSAEKAVVKGVKTAGKELKKAATEGTKDEFSMLVPFYEGETEKQLKQVSKDMNKASRNAAFDFIRYTIPSSALDWVAAGAEKKHIIKGPQWARDLNDKTANKAMDFADALRKKQGMNATELGAGQDVSSVDPVKFAYNLVSGGMSLGAAVGVSAITKNPTAAAVALGMIEGGPEYTASRRAGNSPEKSLMIAGIETAGIIYLEKIGLEFMFRKMVGGKFLSASIKSFTETGQELSQTWWQNLVAKVGYDKSRNIFEGTLDTILYTFPLGFMAGGTIDTLNLNLEKDIIMKVKEETGIKDDDEAREMIESMREVAAKGMDELKTEVDEIDTINKDPQGHIMNNLKGEEELIQEQETDEELKLNYEENMKAIVEASLDPKQVTEIIQNKINTEMGDIAGTEKSTAVFQNEEEENQYKNFKGILKKTFGTLNKAIDNAEDIESIYKASESKEVSKEEIDNSLYTQTDEDIFTKFKNRLIAEKNKQTDESGYEYTKEQLYQNDPEFKALVDYLRQTTPEKESEISVENIDFLEDDVVVGEEEKPLTNNIDNASIINNKDKQDESTKNKRATGQSEHGKDAGVDKVETEKQGDVSENTSPDAENASGKPVRKPDGDTGIRSSLLADEGIAGTKGAKGVAVLDNYFTPLPLINKVWGILNTLDLPKNPKVLEPSAGIGKFFEYAPDGSELVAYEMNEDNFKKLEQLYPDSKNINTPFEDMFIDKRGKKKEFEADFDLVVGNPPYGTHRQFYKKLGEEKSIGTYQEYFIKRSLDVVKEGGYVAMVIPSSFLRGPSTPGKVEISKAGGVLELAYRLPNGIFKNTKVGTDIVIFKKANKVTDEEALIITNDIYFRANSEDVLGEEIEVKGQFGMEKGISGDIGNLKNLPDAKISEEQFIQEYIDSHGNPSLIGFENAVDSTSLTGEYAQRNNPQYVGLEADSLIAKYKELYPEKELTPEQDWEDNYAEKEGELNNKSMELGQKIKTAKKAEKEKLVKEKAKVDKESAKLEEKFTEKHQVVDDETFSNVLESMVGDYYRNKTNSLDTIRETILKQKIEDTLAELGEDYIALYDQVDKLADKYHSIFSEQFRPTKRTINPKKRVEVVIDKEDVKKIRKIGEEDNFLYQGVGPGMKTEFYTNTIEGARIYANKKAFNGKGKINVINYDSLPDESKIINSDSLTDLFSGPLLEEFRTGKYNDFLDVPLKKKDYFKFFNEITSGSEDITPIKVIVDKEDVKKIRQINTSGKTDLEFMLEKDSVKTAHKDDKITILQNKSSKMYFKYDADGKYITAGYTMAEIGKRSIKDAVNARAIKTGETVEDKIRNVIKNIEADNFTREKMQDFLDKLYTVGRVNEGVIGQIRRLEDIKRTIEADNFTRENIDRLIDFIEKQDKVIKADKGKPEYGKQYNLTGKKSIAAGNTWEESKVKFPQGELVHIPDNGDGYTQAVVRSPKPDDKGRISVTIQKEVAGGVPLDEIRYIKESDLMTEEEWADKNMNVFKEDDEYEKMSVTLDNGEVVNFGYQKEYFKGLEDGYGKQSHIKFNSKIVSETGYRSHFFSPEAMQGLSVREYAKGIAEEMSKETQKITTKTRKVAKRKVKDEGLFAPATKKAVKKIAKKAPQKTLVKKKDTMFLTDNTSTDAELVQYTKVDGSLDTETMPDDIRANANKIGGRYYSDFNYFQGDVYGKLKTLELDYKAKEIDKTRYEKQKKGLQAIIPEKILVGDMHLSPSDESIIKNNDMGMKDKDGNSADLDTLFRDYMSELPQEAFTPSSQWEIRAYMSGARINEGDKVLNMAVRDRRRTMANKLFKVFIEKELSNDNKVKLEKYFNERFNSHVDPDYTKNSVILTPVAKKFKNNDLEVINHQIEAVSFLVNKGVGCLAHDVGAGKTMSAIIAIKESLHRGWAKRPFVVVPNRSLYSKWKDEILELFPDQELVDLNNLGGDYKGNLIKLAREKEQAERDGDTDKVNEIKEKMKLPEGSIAMITFSGLNKLGLSMENTEKITAGIGNTIASNADMSKRKKELELQKAEGAKGAASRNVEIEMEDLGLDHVTVDEGHNFKNIFANARVDRGKSNEYAAVTGGSSSIRAMKLYYITQYILKNNNLRNVFLLTATPFTNSPLEIYNMISLMGEYKLQEKGIKNLNDFMSMFMDIKNKAVLTSNERNPVVYKDVVENFKNISSLQSIVKELFSFKSGEDLTMVRPNKKQITINLAQSDLQKKYSDEAQKIWESGQPAAALLAIGEIRKIALSPFLSQYHREPFTYKELIENSPKLKYIMEVIKINKKSGKGAGQVIYLPEGLDLYPYLVDYLVKEVGYKKHEVDVMNATTMKNEEKGYKKIQDFNDGKTKVVIGSGTIKEGVDLQKNTTDLYHLWLPWNPTDMIQVEGRAWRQGNRWKNVRIHYPLGENGGDIKLSQLLDTKIKRIKDIWSYTGNQVIDVTDVNPEDIKYDLTTDPVQRYKIESDGETKIMNQKLEGLQSERGIVGKKIKGVLEAEKNLKTYQGHFDREQENTEEGETNYWQRSLDSAKKELEKAKARIKDENLEDVMERVDAISAEVTSIEEKLENRTEFIDKEIKRLEEEKAEAPAVEKKEDDHNKTIEQIKEENKKGFFALREDDLKGSTKGASIGDDTGIPVEKGMRGLNISPLPLPEMLKLATYLTNKIPVIRPLRANGLFKGGEGIFLNPKLFESEDQERAAKTLAHEIGHAIDYLPDLTLARGNILGRLANLQNHRKGFIAALSNKTEKEVGTILDKRKSLLNKIHYRQVKIEDNTATAKHRLQLSQYKSELSKLMKSLVVNKEVKQELLGLANWWKPYDKAQATPAHIEYRESAPELYADFISVLLNSPLEAQNKASKTFNTFFEYMDTKQDFKTAWDGLQEFLQGHKGSIYAQRDADLQSDQITAKEKMNSKMAEDIDKPLFSKDRVKRGSRIVYESFIEKNRAMIASVEKAMDKGVKLSPNKNPNLMIEELDLIQNDISTLLESVYPIEDAYRELGISDEEFSNLMFYNRVLGDRSEKANPRGHTPETAQQGINYLRGQWGEEKYNSAVKIMKDFQRMYKATFKEGYESGLYKEKIFKELYEDQNIYGTFSVVEHMLEGNASANIIHGIGTFKGVGNLFQATLGKMVAIKVAAKRNEFKQEMAKILTKSLPKEEIQHLDVVDVNDVKTVWIKKQDGELKEMQVDFKTGKIVGASNGWTKTKEGVSLKVFKYKENGITKAVAVDPYIADSINFDSKQNNKLVAETIGIVNNKILRKAFIDYSIRFIVRNPIRDTRKMYRAMSFLDLQHTGSYSPSFLKVLSGARKGMKEAWAYSGGKRTKTVQEVLDMKILGVEQDYELSKKELDEATILQQELSKRNIKISGKDMKGSNSKPRRALEAVVNMVIRIGQTAEAMTKIGAYTMMKEHLAERGETINQETAAHIRNHIGTPNWRKGGFFTPTTNTIAMFSNVALQGYKSTAYLATNPNTRSGYWWRTTKLTVIPNLLMFAASAGLFGDELEKLYKRIGKYRKQNFLVIPLGEAEGETISINIPLDYDERLLHALLWNVLNSVKNKKVDVGDFMQEFTNLIPGLSTSISVPMKWKQYLEGKNPVDDYRGSPILNKDEAIARGFKHGLLPMIEWSWNQVFSGIIRARITPQRYRQETMLDKVFRLPLISAFFEKTNRGIGEESDRITNPLEQRAAKDRLRKKEIIWEHIPELKSIKNDAEVGEISREELQEVYTDIEKEYYKDQEFITKDERTNLQKAFLTEAVRSYDNPYLNSLVWAATNEQKIELLKQFKGDIPDDELNWIGELLTAFRIMSVDTWNKGIQ